MNARKILSGTMALLLAASLPLGALAETYDLAAGSITVEAKADGNQYVSQEGGVQDEIQTTETVITQDKSAAPTTDNTITIRAEEKTNADGSKEKMNAEVTISGVNIDVSNTGDSANYIPGEAAISTGGDGNVTIELDGENALKSGYRHAGLEKNNGGNLTIEDKDDNGVLDAKGGGYGAGIGGGFRGNGSNITIENGNVTANGGKNSAGIGGGFHGNGSNITIEDGNVTAGGGDYGAGIGGGDGGDGTDISITDSNVTANGSFGGAGIGGGYEGNGSNITITDSNVTANGSDEGAGIGGGCYGDGTDITITGGNVTASGGDEGAGIGGGYYGDGTDITVSGNAQVKVSGGEYASDIGGGEEGNGEIAPDTSELGENGSISYFVPNVDKTTTNPEKLLHKTASGVETHENVSIKSKTDPTCTKPGSITYLCSCGEEVTQEIPAIPHSFTNYVPQNDATCEKDGTKVAECDYGCGATHSLPDAGSKLNHDLEHHPAQAPTCTEIGWDEYDTCTRCLYTTYKEIAALNHDLEHHPAQVPTCTEKGWKAYDTCKRPGCTYSTYSELEIDPNNHDLEHHNAKAATCTEIGWDEYDTCTRCPYTTYKEIAALNHDLEHHPAQAATCTEKGWKAYDTCKRSGCTYSTYSEMEIDPNNHDLEHHNAKAATCTEIGWEEYDTCKRCAYSTYKEKSALNHSFTNYVYQQDATCLADGTEIAQCDHTGCTATDERTAKGTALGHSFTDYVSNGDASYEADGTETARCDNGCGATDTRTETGSSLPIYRVTDEAGRELASSRSVNGSVLTITVNQANATLSGTTAGLRVLQARGITTIVFVTTSAASTFEISDLLSGSSYTLTHSGTVVGFTLDGKNVLSFLK